MRKLTTKGKKKKLWKALREYILKRDKLTCQWCKKVFISKKLDTHHIIPKGRCRNAGTYQEENCMCLCDGCHRFRAKNLPHEFDKFQTEWLKKHFNTTQEELNIKYHTSVLWSEDFYETKLKVIKEISQQIKTNQKTGIEVD